VKFLVTEDCEFNIVCHSSGHVVCEMVCPVNAITTPSGRAQINDTTCTSCGSCRGACPYQAIVEDEPPYVTAGSGSNSGYLDQDPHNTGANYTVGEVRLFREGQQPDGFELCAGEELRISSNMNLFELIGTTFGGNGSTNFALPDTRDAEANLGGLRYYINLDGVFPVRDEEGNTPRNLYQLASLVLLAFNWNPQNMFLCDGQSLQISQYTTLFSLTGGTYGGDSRTTFAVPDMTAEAPVDGLYWNIVYCGVYPRIPGQTDSD